MRGRRCAPATLQHPCVLVSSEDPCRGVVAQRTRRERKKNFAPGVHGMRRGKISDYGLHLREKQKVRRTYGILERQFRRYFQIADQRKGVTGDNLLEFLERRLDNVIHRASFANSRDQARQLVRHNHIVVNGQRVNIPSYLTSPGENIQVAEKSRQLEAVHESLRRAREVVPWLSVDKVNLQGTVLEKPNREDIPTVAEEQIVIEFYSRV